MGVSIVEKNGRYELHIRDAKKLGPKRFTRRVPGSGEKAYQLALEKKEQIERKLALGQPIEEVPQNILPTVKEYFETDYQKHLKTLAPKTREQYESDFKKYISGRLGNLRLDAIGRKHVKELIDSLKEVTYKRKEVVHKLSKDSVRGVVATLRKIFSEAIDDELIKVNPATAMGERYRELPKVHEVNPLSKSEVKELFKAAIQHRPVYFPLLAFLIHTGVRIGEAVGVYWTDIDFAARVIHIRGQGKNRVKTKTGRTRQIEMSAFLFKVLMELRREREQCWGKDNIPPHVFVSSTGSPMDADNFRFQQFYKLLELAGLRRIRLHDLRHTFATLHLANGSPLQWVSKQLGHANIKMTCDVYYHYLPDGEGKAKYSATIPTVTVKSPRKPKSTNKLYVVKSA